MFVGRGLGTLELALALTLTAGCQIVFGIDEFEPSGAGEGSTSSGAGVTSGGAGGEGARGGEGGSGGDAGGSPTAGGGGVGGDLVGQPLTFLAAGNSPDSPPTECTDGTVLTLHGGAPTAGCAMCVANAVSGSCSSVLRCFSSNDCPGTGTTIPEDSGCVPIAVAESCSATAPTPPSCQVSGGTPTGDAALPTWGAFCTTGEANCVLLDTIGACNAEYSEPRNLYDLPDGTASCSPCAAPVGACENAATPWKFGGFGLCPFDLAANACASTGQIGNVERRVSTNCTVSPTSTLSVSRSGIERRVCCKPGVLPAELAL